MIGGGGKLSAQQQAARPASRSSSRTTRCKVRQTSSLIPVQGGGGREGTRLESLDEVGDPGVRRVRPLALLRLELGVVHLQSRGESRGFKSIISSKGDGEEEEEEEGGQRDKYTEHTAAGGKKSSLEV